MLKIFIFLHYALLFTLFSWFDRWHAIEFSLIFRRFQSTAFPPIRRQRVAGRQVPRTDDEILGLEVLQLGRFRSRRVARLVGAAVGPIGRRRRRAQNAAIRRVVRTYICVFYPCIYLSLTLSIPLSLSLLRHCLIRVSFLPWFVSSVAVVFARFRPKETRSQMLLALLRELA